MRAPWNTWARGYNEDYYKGQLYTSFDSGKPNTGAKPAASAQRGNFEKVVPIDKAPESMKSETLTIKAEGAVMFWGNKEYLSTFYPATITIDGHQYPSCEHYYQACKLFMLAGPGCAMQIRKITDAGKVKQATRQLLQSFGVRRDQVDEWKSTHGLHILRHALRHKFIQHKELQEKLIATKDNLLLHVYDMDKVYATGCKAEAAEKWLKENEGKELTMPVEIKAETLPYFPKIVDGKNLLGILLMRTRRDCLKIKNLAYGETLEADDPMLHAAIEAMSINDKKESTKENTEQQAPEKVNAKTVQKKIMANK